MWPDRAIRAETGNRIAKVLESIQDDNDAVLIGGQALNIWAEYYAQQDSSLNTYSPFFSHDIDFLGDKDMAAAMHKIWKGEIRVPDMDTHTPMSANLRFNLEDGRPINIDFLEVMIGIDNYNIRKDAQRTKNPNTQKSVLVLHPAHCLRAPWCLQQPPLPSHSLVVSPCQWFFPKEYNRVKMLRSALNHSSTR